MWSACPTTGSTAKKPVSKDAMKAQPQAGHFINGTYVEDTSGTLIDVIYPASGAGIPRPRSSITAS